MALDSKHGLNFPAVGGILQASEVSSQLKKLIHVRWTRTEEILPEINFKQGMDIAILTNHQSRDANVFESISEETHGRGHRLSSRTTSSCEIRDMGAKRRAYPAQFTWSVESVRTKTSEQGRDAQRTVNEKTRSSDTVSLQAAWTPSSGSVI